MRIAVSGTHCVGKSTLIDEFLRCHPDFAHEPEPYTVLVETYGEEFSSEPCVDDFYRQLEFNVAQLRRNSADDPVIYERSPVDFLAYILALKDLKRDDVDSRLVKTALELVTEAVRHLEIIVFLPLRDSDGVDVPADEDPKLRRAVDSRLVSLLIDDELGIIESGFAAIIEARESTTQRLRMIEDAIETRSANMLDG